MFEHDIAGRPDTLPVLAALAAVTEHIGLVGTLNATFNEPYELARQLASLDHLSGGRAGWNVVTSWDAFTGQNFRRGGFLTREERYTRAEEFVNTVRELWDSWAEDAVLADKASGRFLADDSAGRFAHTGSQFDIDGRFTVPRSPQGRPVIVQAGISPQGRDFAAANSDLIFSPFSRLAEAQEFYVDVKARARAHGRNPDDLKIIPGAGFVLGDSRADAEEKARYILEQQLSDRSRAGAVRAAVEPRPLGVRHRRTAARHRARPRRARRSSRASAFIYQDRFETVRRWRALAEEKGLSIRGVAAEVSSRTEYIGTPQQVADALDDFIQNDGADGVVLGGHITPGGIDEFVDKVVPLLQERGSLRTEYTGSTLRENLGLPIPERRGALAATV